MNSVPDIIVPRVPAFEVPPTISEFVPPAEREPLRTRIKELLADQDAVLVAHYYTDAELQILAEDTGGCVSDSLDMARFGHEHPARTLIIAGVRFMGETAKILNPEKRVLMPELKAECSLDLGCPAGAFGAFCDTHPERTVVVYANTSAQVKARSDWVVTSSIAVEVIRHLHGRGEKILWAPDKYLGSYLREETGADMLLWNGACVVHEEFKGLELQDLRRQYPDAKVLVHPESPAAVIAQADVVGSTTQIIEASRRLDARRFIVATDKGIFHKMQEVSLDKEFIEAPTAGRSATCRSCAHCPWMAMNSLRKLLRILETGAGEIHMEETIRRRAATPIQRMLDFAAARKRQMAGDA